MSPAQQFRLAKFSADCAADIHCHCLPGLDDGPPSMDAALALCDSLVADGITHVIATPHQLGPFEGSNGRAVVLEALAKLREQLSIHQIPLVVEPGADVRIDPRLLELLDTLDILTLCDSKAYLLLELPHETLIEPTSILQELADRGLRAILTHPERHVLICQRPELVIPWIQGGALLQVTAGSVLGEFGPAAYTTAWRLLDAGVISLIASDAHDTRSRPPRMTDAIRAIADRLGHAVARRLCIENPNRILTKQPIQPPRIPRSLGAGK